MYIDWSKAPVGAQHSMRPSPLETRFSVGRPRRDGARRQDLKVVHHILASGAETERDHSGVNMGSACTTLPRPAQLPRNPRCGGAS
jgi:hypothetical protein